MKCLICSAAVAGLMIPALLRADDRREARMSPVVRVFQEASPAVVNLSTTAIVTLRSPFGRGGPLDEIFDFPVGRPRQMETHSVGSGFVIHEDGYLVTNAHVVERAKDVRVTFADRTELPAEVIAVDRANDLAVLKVEAGEPLHHLKLGRSDDLMTGESVVAIGNPLGLQHTVTTGIISALNRELVFNPQLRYKGLIQTDASINPGNSGGPLMNVLGELIGINSAIRGDAQNIGFAIPVDRLREQLPRILDLHRLRRVKFGLEFDDLHSGPEGVRIAAVEKGSPAESAGVKPGDVLTAIDAASTPDFMSAFSVLSRSPVDKPLTLNLLRAGRRTTANVALAGRKLSDSVKLAEARFGIRPRELKQEEISRLGLPRAVGLMVTDVAEGSPAATAGIEPGDIVTLMGGLPVTTISTLDQLLEQIAPGDKIPFQILRIRSPEEWQRGEVLLQAAR